jgi:WhiB family redox-sensing transcriptional regulator
MMTTAWKTQGLCFGHPDPDLWFPADARRRGTFEAALAVCAQCPVIDKCWEYAEETGVTHGVWAGVNRSKPAKTTDHPPQHGTEARARRHRRAGEDPCPACLEGERSARRLRETRRPA